jgi:hypothetical protein
VKKFKFFIIALFLAISVFAVYKIVFNGQFIGRSLDYPVPPADYLVKNVYLNNFYQWWDVANGGSRGAFSATLIPVNSILYLPVLFGGGSWFVS